MKKPNEWTADYAIYRFSIPELIRLVQIDAYNTAIQDALKNVMLTTTNSNTRSKTFQTYLPNRGATNIEIDEQSILRLLKTN